MNISSQQLEVAVKICEYRPASCKSTTCKNGCACAICGRCCEQKLCDLSQLHKVYD